MPWRVPWRKSGPDALICTGDLTQRARHSEYARAAQWFACWAYRWCWNPRQSRHALFQTRGSALPDPFRRYNTAVRAAGGELNSSRPSGASVPLRTTVRIQRRIPWSDGGVIRRAAIEDTLAPAGGA